MSVLGGGAWGGGGEGEEKEGRWSFQFSKVK